MKKNLIALTGFFLATAAFAQGEGILLQANKNQSAGRQMDYPATFSFDKADPVATAPAKTITLTEASNPYGKYYKEDVADDHINYWVFEAWAANDYFLRGIIHGTTPYSANRDFVRQWPNFPGSIWFSGEETIDAGCMVGNEYWAYVSNTDAGNMAHHPNGIYVINLETGATERRLFDDSSRYNESNIVLNEMSYDPATGYVYGLLKQATGWLGTETLNYMYVVRIDPDRPESGWELMGRIDYAFTMACDDGYMYLTQNEWIDTGEVEYDVFGDPHPILENRGVHLRKISLEDYAYVDQTDLEEIGLINHGFLKINYLQTMEFDHSDHTLYWFGAQDDYYGTGFITTLDVETAETGDPLMDMVSNTQYIAAAIPYEEVEAEAAHYVRNLSYIVGSEGNGEVEFQWTNPSTNSYKNSLSSLTEIKIYRDNELYATVPASGIGAVQSWKDEDVASGYHLYRFVPVNAAGDGLSRYRTIFIGRDMPGAVTDITIIPAGASATISWNPSTVGEHKGWYDKASQKYDVVRYPDNVTVATGISETSITDNVDAYYGYSYQITPSNVDGVGPAAVSSIVPFGPAVALPYYNNLSTEELGYQLTVLDNNHDGNWMRFTDSPSNPDGHVWIYDYNESKPDEWLITPDFLFEEGKLYQIRLIYATSNYIGTQEKIEIRQGFEKTAEGQSTLLGTIIGLPDYYGNYLMAVFNGIEPKNGNCLSFHLDSEPQQGWVHLKYLEVREYCKTDASAQDITGSQMAYVGSENSYQVTIKNEGSANLRGAKAQIVDEEGNVLAETAAPAMRPGEEKTIEVAWTPEAPGEFRIYGNAYVAGDGYPADNRSETCIDVVVEEGSPSQWTTVLRNDGASWQPLYVMLGSAGSTTIYSPTEIGKKDITITGIAYTYSPADDPKAAGLDAVPVKVEYLLTDRFDFYVGEIYPTVLEGFNPAGEAVVSMAGTSAKNDITIMFDHPFYYDGTQNVCFCTTAMNTEPTGDNPYWFVQNEWADTGENCRSQYVITGGTPRYGFYPPIIKLAYQEGNTEGDGIDGVITLGANVKVNGRTIAFEKQMDSIAVYDLSGRLVATAKNAANITLNAAGVYNVVGTAGKDVYSTKVVIR